MLLLVDTRKLYSSLTGKEVEGPRWKEHVWRVLAGFPERRRGVHPAASIRLTRRLRCRSCHFHDGETRLTHFECSVCGPICQHCDARCNPSCKICPGFKHVPNTPSKTRHQVYFTNPLAKSVKSYGSSSAKKRKRREFEGENGGGEDGDVLLDVDGRPFHAEDLSDSSSEEDPTNSSGFDEEYDDGEGESEEEEVEDEGLEEFGSDFEQYFEDGVVFLECE